MQFTTKTVNYKGRNKYGDYVGYRKPVKGACDNGRWELTGMYVNTVPYYSHEANRLEPDQSNYKWIEGELSYMINDGYEDVAIQTITGLTMTPVYTGDPHAHHYKIVGDKMYWNDVDFGTTVVDSFGDRVYCSYNGVVYSGETYSRSVDCAANEIESVMSHIDSFRTTGGATSAITIESGGTEIFFEAQATRTTTYTSTKYKTEVVTDIWNEGNGKLYLTSDIGTVDHDSVDFGENPSSVTRTGYVRVIDDNVPSVHSDITVTQDAAPYVPVVPDYMAFEILTGGTIVWKQGFDTSSPGETPGANRTISYSLNSGTTWTDITSSQAGVSFNVNAGDTVLFKGTNSCYGGFIGQTIGYDYWNTFSGSTATFNLKGNVMSMIYGDNFEGQTTLSEKPAFPHMFQRTRVINASGFVLPTTSFPSSTAATAYTGCYEYMFANCNLLNLAPELPATGLSDSCYRYMFYGCTSLTTAPALSATTLAYMCYAYMFQGCSSLREMPALPATSLTTSCYLSMFQNCTSLTSAKTLSASILVDYCYYSMFYGCSSLSYIRCHATRLSGTYCTGAWTYGVATGGTFVKSTLMVDDWTTGTDGIPEGWTVLEWGPIPIDPTNPLSGDTGGGQVLIPDEP